MNIAATISRILLGLVFVAAGASGFFLINSPPPPMPGLAGTFQDVFFQTRWVLYVDAIDLIAGVLLLANRYVPLALILVAAIAYNMCVFHLTMMPIGLPAPILLLILGLIVASQHRAVFAPLFAARA
jgi:putative oxidoreductase